jgi:hypothetical protein
MRGLERELGICGYFQNRKHKRRELNLGYVALALNFFDARLRKDGTIDWQDE